MEEDSPDVIEKIQELGDLELACLLCFVAEQHAFLVEAGQSDIEALENELQLIAQSTFGLSAAVLRCTESTTLEDFANGILVDQGSFGEQSPSVLGDSSRTDYITSTVATSSKPYSKRPRPYYRGAETRIADIIIASGLNLTHEQVQIQALELIRSKRIHSRTQVQTAPKGFLFIPIVAQSTGRLNPLLLDHIFLSVTHLPTDPLIHSDSDGLHLNPKESNESLASVIRTPPATPSPSIGILTPSNHRRRSLAASRTTSANSVHGMIQEKQIQPQSLPLITQADIQSLVHSCSQVTLSSDLRAYIHDIIVFLRTHRALALSPPAKTISSSSGRQEKFNPNDTLPGPGVSVLATRHFHVLVRALCALHGLDFVTPSLVSLAARKVYPHRLRISAAERDRGLMYGGDSRGTKEWYRGYESVEDVIEEVLEVVEAPL